MTETKIQSGLYLIVDPAMNKEVLLNKLKQALTIPLAAVQILDNFKQDCNIKSLVLKITSICKPKNVPVLINNQWQLLLETNLDGVHFDSIPNNFQSLQEILGSNIIVGITCGNDLSVVKWAKENRLDYISFCSLLPSSTANNCELVSFETIKEAHPITYIPVFLLEGIKPDNKHLLSELNYSGLALVSEIMNEHIGL